MLSRQENPEQFPGAVVGLGGLGVVTRLTLDIVPAFDMRQDVYENLPLAALEQHFDEIQAGAYSVSLFTDWRGPGFNQLWVKRRVADGTGLHSEQGWFGATLATRHLHPIADLPAEHCTEQMGIHGPCHERLPHFRMDYTPSNGEELQSEYFVPRHYAWDAIRVVHNIREKIAPLLHISEVRTIAADDLWMSPCFGQACVAIHFTWKQDWPAVSNVLPRIEQQLEPFAARPHWGKLFTMPPDRLRSLYPKLPDFQHLLRSCDPGGKFRNVFLDRYISV